MDAVLLEMVVLFELTELNDRAEREGRSWCQVHDDISE